MYFLALDLCSDDTAFCAISCPVFKMDAMQILKRASVTTHRSVSRRLSSACCPWSVDGSLGLVLLSSRKKKKHRTAVLAKDRSPFRGFWKAKIINRLLRSPRTMSSTAVFFIEFEFAEGLTSPE